MPIIRSQSDSLFLRHRSQKSVLQSAVYIFRKLLKSKKTKKNIQFSSIKVKKKHFNVFAGKKATFKVFDTTAGNSKTELLVFNCLIYTTKNRELVSLKYPNQHYYLNFGVDNHFYQMRCQAMYSQIPVASKYLFFVKP